MVGLTLTSTVCVCASGFERILWFVVWRLGQVDSLYVVILFHKGLKRLERPSTPKISKLSV